MEARLFVENSRVFEQTTVERMRVWKGGRCGRRRWRLSERRSRLRSYKKKEWSKKSLRRCAALAASIVWGQICLNCRGKEVQ